jgi:hypothetical protein
MSRKLPAEPLLGEDHVAFLRHRVSVNVSSRDPGNVPSLARTIGCRISPDRRRVTVFVSPSRGSTVLEDLRRSGAIAVVFSRPKTHQTIQLKAADAVIEPLAPGDAELIAGARQAFVDELLELGYTERFAQAVTADSGADAVAVSFTPTAAFEQTPGPGAGRQLGHQSP